MLLCSLFNYVLNSGRNYIYTVKRRVKENDEQRPILCWDFSFERN